MFNTQAKINWQCDPTELFKPGLKHVAVEHDSGCPQRDDMGHIGTCTCSEVNIRVWTEAQAINHMMQTREQRRKAQREADAAIRRARKSK